jgi:hypothetical protein
VGRSAAWPPIEPTALFQGAQRSTCGDPKQPGASIRDARQTFTGAQRCEKGLMCEVFCQRQIAYQARQVPIKGSLILLEYRSANGFCHL